MIVPTLKTVAFVELFLCWAAWLLAFLRRRIPGSKNEKAVRAPASKWGIFLVIVSFVLVAAYVRPAGFTKSQASLIASMILGPLSVALAWAAARHLGKQLRYAAAVSEDDELIQTGPYGWVRHPIYTSMLGMLLATGSFWTWWPMFVAALIVFLAGTEIRVRAEEKLLAERFKQSFSSYRSRVPAFIPFLR